MLRYLLQELESPSNDEYQTAYLYALTMGVLALVHTIIHHVLFFHSMRVGWNWKIGSVGVIYKKLFSLSSSSTTTTETGRLVNLISNDVFRFETFPIFAGTCM